MKRRRDYGKDFDGLFVPILTPFKVSGEIDFLTLEKHLAFLDRSGVNGVCILTVTGEFPSLSFEEKKEITEFVTNHRGNLKTLVSAGSSSLMETIEITKFCEQKRVDAVVICLPFFYTNIHPDGILNYCAMIFENTNQVPIILYNIPQYTRAEIDERLLQRLCDYEHMCGILDESGNFFNILGFFRNFATLKIFSGSDLNFQQAASSKVPRLLSPLANVFPEFMLNGLKKYLGGQPVTDEQNILTAFYRLARTANNMGVLKFLLGARGEVRESQVRPPLLPLEEERKRELLDFCKSVKLLA